MARETTRSTGNDETHFLALTFAFLIAACGPTPTARQIDGCIEALAATGEQLFPIGHHTGRA